MTNTIDVFISNLRRKLEEEERTGSCTRSVVQDTWSGERGMRRLQGALRALSPASRAVPDRARLRRADGGDPDRLRGGRRSAHQQPAPQRLQGRSADERDPDRRTEQARPRAHRGLRRPRRLPNGRRRTRLRLLPRRARAPQPGTITRSGDLDVAAAPIVSASDSILGTDAPRFVQYARPETVVDDTINRLWLFLGGGVAIGTVLAGLAPGWRLATGRCGRSRR